MEKRIQKLEEDSQELILIEDFISSLKLLVKSRQLGEGVQSYGPCTRARVGALRAIPKPNRKLGGAALCLLQPLKDGTVKSPSVHTGGIQETEPRSTTLRTACLRESGWPELKSAFQKSRNLVIKTNIIKKIMLLKA